MRSLIAAILSLTALLIVALALVRTPPLEAQLPLVRGPFIGEPVEPSSFDGRVRAEASGATVMHRELVRPSTRAAISTPALPFVSDPVRQFRQAGPSMPAPGRSFPGLALVPYGAGWPPDPNGDVGPNHYVQMVNIAFGIYDKSGSLLLASRLDGFFSGTGTPCDYANQGDPVVIYDSLADRWVLSDMAWRSTAGPFYECLAVSKTSDPVSGGWWQYAVPTDPRYLNDYPKLALWPDAYYMSANLFAYPAGAQQGVRVWALDRQAMLQGQTLATIYFDIPCEGTCYNTLLPATLHGTPPAAGEPEFFASIDEPNLLHLWKFHVDWSNLGNSTFTGPTNLRVAPFFMPCYAATQFQCVPQLNGESVDALGDRLMMQLQYRNVGGTESLWANHTVAASRGPGSPTGIRWYEIRNPNGAPIVYQQGTFQPDSNYRWMGSLAVDQAGNMALGYSVSSKTMYPAIRYAGRLATDPLNVLGQGETSLIAGTGSQFGGYNRWGDYTAMTVDPVDECTFWYTNEYYASTGSNWQTRIGSFKFPSCGSIRPQLTIAAPTPTPRPGRCEDSYEPDNSMGWAHTITGPELHNFAPAGDIDWVKFPVTGNWVYHIKANPPTNLPTQPHLALYVDGAMVAENDHAFGNGAELWWWNNGPDRTAFVRVNDVNNRGECGNTQYTLSVQGTKDAP